MIVGKHITLLRKKRVNVLILSMKYVIHYYTSCPTLLTYHVKYGLSLTFCGYLVSFILELCLTEDPH